MTKILVIEDETDIRDNIMDVLEAEGFSVDGAPNGKVGVQQATELLPDLLICDIMMPEMDGFQVLETLQKDARTAAIPFIFLSARSDREALRTGMNLGADDYVPKPFTRVELLKAINTRLKKQSTIENKYQSTMNLLRQNITYVLPHELRTPLTHILGYSDILISDAARMNPPEIVEMSEAVFAAGKRLQRVVENYLIYAQIEIIKTDPTRTEAIRNHITADTPSVIGARATTVASLNNRASDLRLDFQPLALNIAQSNLEKIIDELVDNAFKFSQPGTPVEVSTVKTARECIIIIRDFGRGITPEQAKKIGAYMQFDRTLYEQQGIGLGLVIAKNLTELHKGKFEVETKPGHGTRIRLKFPF